MSDYDLAHLSERDFEHMVQAIATKVIGPGVNIFGDGPDGAREATFDGPMSYPSPANGWDGYLVVQAKHRPRPTTDPEKDGKWALDQLTADLAKFNDPHRKLRRPEYYIFATNIVLTPVWERGSHDRAREVLKSAADKIGLRGFDVWHFDKICRFLDAHRDILAAYRHLLTPGHLLAEQMDKTASMAVQIDQMHSALMRSTVTTGDGGLTAGADAKEQIDRAGRYMEQGKLEVAFDLLTEVEKEFGDRLSAKGHYRVLANKGTIARAKGEWEEAARFYLQAKDFQPIDKDARLLEATAHSLLGENDTALRLVKALRIEHPEMARACALEISLAPAGASDADLAARVPPEHREDAEVLMALAHRGAVAGKFQAVEDYARRAHYAAPKWNEATLLLADVILENEFASANWADREDLQSDQLGRFREALALFDEALEGEQPVTPSRRVRAELNRALAYDALGATQRAASEFQHLYTHHSDIAEVAFRHAQSLAARGRTDEAITVLEPFVTKADDVFVLQSVLFYAQALAERGSEKEALRVLQNRKQQWAQYPLSIRASWVQTLVRLLIADHQIAQARTILRELPSNSLSQEMKLALEARIEQIAGDQTRALVLAEEAERHVSNDSHSDDVRRLAQTFEILGKPETALRLWKRVAPRDRITQTTRQMLECAARINDDDLIIEVCANLRRKGQTDRKLLDLEIAALGRRSPRSAAEIIHSLLKEPFDDPLKRFLRLRLSHIGLYTKEPELVETAPEMLPRVDEVNAHMGRAVVSVLTRSNVNAAVRYAYELYRRFPDDFDAHMAVFESFGVPLRAGPAIKKPTVVRPGCAVCFQREGTRTREWWIIEDGPNPSLSRSERPSSDPAVQQMLGKGKGEKFNFRVDPFPIEAKIIEIEDKTVYRWRECFSGMESRFAHETPIWAINVKRGKKYDFTRFLKELDRKAKADEERDEWYQQNPVPLSFYAKQAGTSILEAMIHVAGSENLPIRCCMGSADEINAAMAALNSCIRVLLDGSALSTLFITNTSSVLEQLPVECIVAEHTLYDFKRMRLLDHQEGKGLNTIGKHGNHYVQDKWSPDDLKAFQERVRRFIFDVEKSCTILPGGSLTRIPAEHREVLMDVCGRGIAESMVASTEPNSVLWTDDRVVSDLAYESLKTRRVWTQAVVEWLASAQLVSGEVQDRLSVDLQVAGYFWTRLSPRAIVGAAKDCGWDIGNRRFAAAIGQFSRAEGDLEALTLAAAGVLRLTWQSGLPAVKPEVVTIRILSLFNTRPDGYKAIQRLIKDRLIWFGNDAFNAERFRQCALIWHQTNRRIIVPSMLQ